ncbi:hypothetical protein [Dyella acidisoli]
MKASWYLRACTLVMAFALVLGAGSLFAQDEMPLQGQALQATPKSSIVDESKPVIDINLVSFNPIVGDVKGRLTVI